MQHESNGDTTFKGKIKINLAKQYKYNKLEQKEYKTRSG